jgi:hypothetical protein
MENEKRFYILVPETVQATTVVETSTDTNPVETVNSFRMVAGRLLAQAFHIGRKIESWRCRLNVPYEEITAISLSVRNTRELQKVSKEIANSTLPYGCFFDTFFDTNPDFYGTSDRVQTATVVGPVLKEDLDEVIGHLELYR